MANRSWENFGHFYAPHTMPVLLDCNFVVDSSNANGLGISSLKGPGITQVLMHTSSTPATAYNPAVGLIMVHLQSKYFKTFRFSSSMVSTTSGSNIVVTSAGAALTIGAAYVITVVGTSTAADWLTLGVPAGVTPAVGVSFVALATGAGTGSGNVKIPAATGSGISHIEMVGDPNAMIAPGGFGNGGAWFTLQALGATNSTTTTFKPVAPADGTIISLQFYMSNSSVTVSGE